MTGSRRASPQLLLVSILFGAEGSLYSAIAPLLPHYAQSLHVSRSGTGLLVATYSAGLIAGSTLAGQLVGRIGPRRTIVLGLGVVGLSSFVFGFAESEAALDAFRSAQGCGAGLIWAAGLAWLISTTSPERRGALIGTALGAAIFGTLIGPLIGTLAAVVSTRLIFAVIASLSIAFAAFVARSSAPESAVREPGASLRSALGARRVRAGLWIVLLPAATISVVNTLVPLRMARLGASGVTVGIAFVAAAATATAMSPLIGRLTDRLGALGLARKALAAVAPCLAILLLPSAVWAVGILTVVFVGAALTACMIPAVTLLTQATDAAGLSPGAGAMVLNISFALGETVGAIAGANIAQIAGEEVPLALLAGLTLFTAYRLPRMARASLRSR
jgi:MFS family permease